MKQFVIGLLWLAGLVAAGAALGRHFIPDNLMVAPVYLGALTGGLLFSTLAGFGWLPGTRQPRGTPIAWGLRQAAWLFLQFFAMQIAGQLAMALLITFGGILLARRMHIALPDGGSLVIIPALMAGYFASAGWCLWYISRLGRARVQDGAPSGIGWRPAPSQAYITAGIGLLGVALIAVLLQHVFPPGPNALKDNPLNKIFGTHGWKLAVLFGLAVLVAPVTEEFVFRGGILAALAGRFGTLWAALVTSLLFTVAHAQEYYAYLPGLAAVGTAAIVLAWLRIRYRSIRPGILLHILFNAFSVLAVAFGHG